MITASVMKELKGSFKTIPNNNFNELNGHCKDKDIFFCLENKLTTYNYVRNAIKYIIKNFMKYEPFLYQAKRLQLLNRFVADIKDEGFEGAISGLRQFLATKNPLK